MFVPNFMTIPCVVVDISLKTANVNLLMALEEKSEDHQSQ